MADMPEVTPDPKPERRKGNRARRVKDTKAIVRGKLAHPHCAACGTYGGNGHHVLPKDRNGDDDERNIVTLCGSGTARCHGAHHGSPYVVARGREWPTDPSLLERRDAEWVNRKVGQTIVRERADTIEYLIEKLGATQARVFMEDTYYVTGGIEWSCSSSA